MNTILITGCSSGFGLATARHFLDRGWKVIATMRTVRPGLLPPSPQLRLLALDVNDPESIRHAIEAAGPIDVLVNNAGVGLMGVFEGSPLSLAREVFETNTFGTLRVTHAVLPQFRLRQSGVVVNVSSSTTLLPLPMLSVYTASKAAVNAFTESLALELKPFNVRVHLVLPGRSPETSFGANAQSRMQHGVPAPYAEFVQGVLGARGRHEGPLTHASDVVEAIWRAATDPACPLRLPAGGDARALVEAS